MQVAVIRRVVSASEQHAVTGKEIAHHKSLNPLLADVPFDSQEAVDNFFRSYDRIVALQRYVQLNVDWSEANFCRKMVRLLCTLQYRYDYAFPGDKTYKVSNVVSRRKSNEHNRNVWPPHLGFCLHSHCPGRLLDEHCSFRR